MSGQLTIRPKAKVKRPEPGRSGTYRPRTPLGKELLAIRKRFLDSGEPLWDITDVERELASRRGEVEAKLL
jgi:hypothetical protein